MPIIENMPNSLYQASEGISKSGLDLIARSPAHYRYAAKREPSRAMEIGTAIHTAILEPDRFASDYMILRDVTARTASAYKDAVKQFGSERVLTGPEADKVAGMQESVWANPEARDFLRNQHCRRELSIFTNDPVTGVFLKVRFDATVGVAGLDLKKTQDCRPEKFIRSVWDYRYHVQQAFYSDVFEWETGETLDDFRFLAIEEDAPNAVKLYRLPHDVVAHGRKLYRAALNTYAECLASGHWPAPSGETETLNPTGWMLAEIENDADESGMTFGDEQ